MKPSDVVSGGLVPAYQDAPEPVQPTVVASTTQRGALKPASLLMVFRLLAAAADVRGETELRQGAPNLIKVVTLVQTHSLRLLRSGFRPWRRHALQGRPHQFHVMAVGPIHRRTCRNALGFRQQAALDAPLTQVGRVGAAFSPPKGDLVRAPSIPS